VSTRKGLRGPGYLTIARDILATGTAVFTIVYQTLTGQVSPWLVGFASLALGVQGAAAVIALALGVRADVTPPSPLPSPEQDSSSLPF